MTGQAFLDLLTIFALKLYGQYPAKTRASKQTADIILLGGITTNGST